MGEEIWTHWLPPALDCIRVSLNYSRSIWAWGIFFLWDIGIDSSKKIQNIIFFVKNKSHLLDIFLIDFNHFYFPFYGHKLRKLSNLRAKFGHKYGSITYGGKMIYGIGLYIFVSCSKQSLKSFLHPNNPHNTPPSLIPISVRLGIIHLLCNTVKGGGDQSLC